MPPASAPLTNAPPNKPVEFPVKETFIRFGLLTPLPEAQLKIAPPSEPDEFPENVTLVRLGLLIPLEPLF